uniref:Uncharacterized protein n=1 Tax=Timema tahoe TaxID=61484 RepID=A0A7R9IGC0_9NEOP|nr:unnamed protein product [Timema tahoe]
MQKERGQVNEIEKQINQEFPEQPRKRKSNVECSTRVGDAKEVELKVIADDFEEFKLFLNNSYNANEFYVRDIVGLATYVIDEFSLRRHIDFVPGIVNEMWDIMGESGKAVHKSILWIIEAIKTSYQKAVAFINGILKVWSYASKTNTSKLQLTQNKILCTLTGANRRTIIPDLHTMTNCRQLQEIYHDRNKKFYDKTETHENELVRRLGQYDPTEPRHKRPRLAYLST